jgi:chromate transporter
LVVSCALSRAGPLGGLTALLLWNFPGLVILTASGIVIDAFVDPENPPWFLIGLPPAAIALVYVAFYSFALKLDKLGTLLALLTCLAAILINNEPTISPQSSQFVFPTALALSGFVSYVDSKRSKPFGTYAITNTDVEVDNEELIKRIGIPLWIGACLFATWLIVLITSILLVNVAELSNVYLEIFEKMFRIGSIIYGGGQVVLPLLQDEVVPFWMTSDQFFQGLGLAQSMPGPLFNFSAYLGAVYQGVPGALTAFIGLFGPGIILIFAAVPFWARIRNNVTFKIVLQGINASAIGLIGAACVTLWVSAIGTAADAMVFSISLTMASVYAFQAPYCVLVGGIVGAILHPDALNLGQRSYCVKSGYQKVE